MYWIKLMVENKNIVFCEKEIAKISQPFKYILNP